MKKQDNMNLKAGALVYLDSFAGLVPCKALRVYHGLVGSLRCDYEVTVSRGAYSKGTQNWAYAHSVIPRGSIQFHRNRSPTVWAYTIEVTP
jgi:hypothetical protein